MGKVIAILLVVLMGVGGAVGGYMVRPPPEDPEPGEPVVEDVPKIEAAATFRDGFIVPVLRDGQVWSHVILALGVASDQTEQEAIFQREPILRDGLTEALFLHGSLGNFDGDFTDPNAMARLRERLDAVLQARLDDPTAHVLIVSMARQAG